MLFLTGIKSYIETSKPLGAALGRTPAVSPAVGSSLSRLCKRSC
jgi:hypothetical protein